MPAPGEITQLLTAFKNGDLDAESKLVDKVYPDLRSIARHYMARERPDHTLQPTALVNEAYLRVMQDPVVDWKDRAHFLASASVAMRRVLVTMPGNAAPPNAWAENSGWNWATSWRGRVRESSSC